MERKSNITVWQLRLFEGLDRDVMVMQRDEEEIFDNAIHVFFEKEYYDAYVSKAKKYSSHSYAYHEDKLGEVIYQIFDEQIPGLVLHINSIENGIKNMLADEKYISAKDLFGLKEVVDDYHHMYQVKIQRMPLEQAVAAMWNRNVFIIGQLPQPTQNPEEKQVVELMTMRRKADGIPATPEDFDHESLKVFLTPDSAMRFNPDKKPVNRYKLGLLASFVKGKLQVIIEPHRNYWMEFDPANIDLTEYIKNPSWNDEKVRARVQEYTQMDEVYVLLAVPHCDYRACVGTPFLVKLNANNIMMYLFEKYEDAVKYVLDNQGILPVYDGTYPIGVLKKNDKMANLKNVISVAAAMGVQNINLDMETVNSIGCKMPFFLDCAGYETEFEQAVDASLHEVFCQEKEGEKLYRFPVIPFVQQENPYEVSEERKKELIAHLDTDYDMGVTYMADCTLSEMLVMMNEAGRRFEEARTAKDEAGIKKFNILMNLMTVPVTEALCDMPYVYTLRNDDGSFTLKNELAYLITTNRFEIGRQGEGKLAPSGIENETFMNKLAEAAKVVIITDGPNALCLADVRLMSEVAKQKKKAEPLREELLIYMTQGLGLSYPEAMRYYRRLKSDNSIFVEFTACVRNGEYTSVGMIEIGGYTAKKLADEKGLNPLQAYDTLLSIKEKGGKADEVVKTTAKAVVEETESEEKETTKEKSFFGKLFKK